MFGSDDERGQLALLDAMVFFAIALLVSSMLLSQARQDSGPSSTRGEEAYADSALQAFLGASIGASVSIELEEPVEIGPWEKVSDCLLAELHSLLDGHPIKDFDPLNTALTDILESVVHRPFHFSLSACEVSESHATELLELSNVIDNAGEFAYASSTIFAEEDGALLMIVLQLRPPALPEVDRI